MRGPKGAEGGRKGVCPKFLYFTVSDLNGVLKQPNNANSCLSDTKLISLDPLDNLSNFFLTPEGTAGAKMGSFCPENAYVLQFMTEQMCLINLKRQITAFASRNCFLLTIYNHFPNVSPHPRVTSGAKSRSNRCQFSPQNANFSQLMS